MSIVVLNDMNIFYELDGKFYNRPQPYLPTSLNDLVQLGGQLGGRTIWICPRSRLSKLAASDPQMFQADDKIDMRATTTTKGIPMFMLAWKREGTWKERNAVKIAFPEHDERWPFRDCVTATTLLKSGTILEHQLGCEIAWGPGHVGLELIKGKNAKRQEWIRPSKFDPFIETQPVHELEWKAPLVGKKFVHIRDKNSQYLAATTSLNLGAGDMLPPKKIDFNPKLPGLWEIHLSRHPNLRFFPAGHQWLWTPEMEYVRQTTDDFIWLNAIVWPEYHQTLRSWGEKMWDTRVTLKALRVSQPGQFESYHLAYESIKIIYIQTMGGLAHPPDYGESQFYRPDWWELIKSKSKAVMLWKCHQLEEAGCRIVWLNHDALGIESDEEAPEKAFMGLLPLKDTLGGWKHVSTHRVDEEVDRVFSDEMSFYDARKALKKIAGEV